MKFIKIILLSIISSCTYANCGEDPVSALSLYFKLKSTHDYEVIANCTTDEALEKNLKRVESLMERVPSALKRRPFIDIPYKNYKSGKYGAKGFYIESLTLRSKLHGSKPIPKIVIISVSKEQSYYHILYRTVEDEELYNSVSPEIFTVINQNGILKFAKI